MYCQKACCGDRGETSGFRGQVDLQTLSLPLGYAAIPLFRLRLSKWLRSGVTTAVTTSSVNPCSFLTDRFVAQSPISLRGHDRTVTEQLLEGRQLPPTSSHRQAKVWRSWCTWNRLTLLRVRTRVLNWPGLKNGTSFPILVRSSPPSSSVRRSIEARIIVSLMALMLLQESLVTSRASPTPADPGRGGSELTRV